MGKTSDAGTKLINCLMVIETHTQGAGGAVFPVWSLKVGCIALYLLAVGTVSKLVISKRLFPHL